MNTPVDGKSKRVPTAAAQTSCGGGGGGAGTHRCSAGLAGGAGAVAHLGAERLDGCRTLGAALGASLLLRLEHVHPLAQVETQELAVRAVIQPQDLLLKQWKVTSPSKIMDM